MEVTQGQVQAVWVMAQHLLAYRVYVVDSVGHMRTSILLQCEDTPCEHTRMLSLSMLVERPQSGLQQHHVDANVRVLDCQQSCLG
jgi:hypothetical protein